jgi:hypothetical protein
MVPSPIALSEEKFLVFDIAEGNANALFLRVDRDRNLTIEKFERGVDLKKFLGSVMQKIANASWEGAHVFNARRRILAVADSALATTMPIPLEFSRGPSVSDRRLTHFELEETISQAMVKIIPQCRAEAAERFKTDTLGVVLVAAKAKHFIIDKKRTDNPIGFVGDRVSLVLELTFTTRDLFDDFYELFSSSEPFFFEESAQASLSAVARVKPLPLNLFTFRAGASANLSIFDAPRESYPVLYRETSHWPFEDALLQIQDYFSVGREAALDMYEMYCCEKLSADAARGMRPLIQPSADLFFKDAECARLKGSIFIDAPYSLPFEMPLQRGKAAYEPLPLKEILEKVGLRMNPDSLSLPPHILFRHVAPFIEMYFERNHSQFNEGIRRRLHWLTR